MAITLDTRCIQHGLSGSNKTLQTLINTCSSPPPSPGKLSSWTDAYDGNACEIKYYSILLSISPLGLGVISKDYYVLNVQINATTPSGQTLTAGPTTLRVSTLDTSLTNEDLTLEKIPEGSDVTIFFGAGYYYDKSTYSTASSVELQDPATGSPTSKNFKIYEDKSYWVVPIGKSSGGGGGLFPPKM